MFDFKQFFSELLKFPFNHLKKETLLTFQSLCMIPGT